jgi:divalent metal cation (Fe/Co/Zn/Cd) transporter
VIGVLVAFAGIGLEHATGDAVYDAAASVAIGALLVLVAYAIGQDSKQLLLGAAATGEQLRALEETLRRHPDVDALLELRTMVLSPGRLLVAARLDFAEGIDSDRVEQLSDELDRRLRDAVPDVQEVFLDATRQRGRRTAEAG